MKGNVDGGQRIAQGDTGMGKRGGVYQDEFHRFLSGCLHPVNQFGLAITLEVETTGDCARLACCSSVRLMSSRVVLAIDIGLTLAKEIEVGAMQNKNCGH